MKVPPLDLELIYRNGKPVRAVINVEALAALLDAVEDLDDIEYLHALKEEELQFVSFQDYLNSRGGGDDHSTGDDKAHGTDVPDRHREAS
jgi:hypothetical protein